MKTEIFKIKERFSKTQDSEPSITGSMLSSAIVSKLNPELQGNKELKC